MVSDNIMLKCYYNFTVPSSPPQNVMVMTLDEASLNVTWQPPLEINQNGPITSYFITYERIRGSLTSVTTTETEYTVISGLIPFVIYSVQVAARTIDGIGSLSSAVMQVSGQDCKYK